MTTRTQAAAGPAPEAQGEAAAAAAAERVWRNLRALVLEQNEGRKAIAEALGMSFFRAKALRRIAARPSRMSELATELGTDRPYLTLIVDDLARRGLVERHQHPADRRCKIVTATAEGRATAARADAILGTPPPSLRTLTPDDLAALDRITSALAAGGG
ncbi:MarR family transcriptional regulator [Streptomyces sp. V4-01]|uniref:MarR family transcriptional regulator n=1 Tax=Actinacidiphila polyblastidii TaxID=3110430 RepID=A0ABU7PEZ6_9ACTN|nr:MarR family transcriptional regulator [Streptomyces sp. V4-01]